MLLYACSAVLIWFFVATSASPLIERTTRCTNPVIRKEWRSLSKLQRLQYIDAVKCLANKPAIAQTIIPAAISRYDDFQGVHCAQTDAIHFVGHFLPWHRYFVAAYEEALRKECGWKLGQPYWDWLIDSESGKSMSKFAVFDPVVGFGGNGPWEDAPNGTVFEVPGRTGGGCVQDGPFTYDKFQLSIGPGTNVSERNKHCLTRDFSPEVVHFNLERSVWNGLLGQTDYGSFARSLEGLPTFDVPTVHGGGHFGVGGSLGTMGNQYNSPGDPIFYLHHGNLDRLFWLWQKKNLLRRLHEVSGPIFMFDYDNDRGGNVTLDFKVNLEPLKGSVTLESLLDIRGDVLCYQYE